METHESDAGTLPLPKPCRQREPEYLTWVRTQPCCVCNAPAPSEAHHMVTRGAGGSDCLVVPLCWACHKRAHYRGLKRFAEEHHLASKLAVLRSEYEAAGGRPSDATQAIINRANLLATLYTIAQEDGR